MTITPEKLRARLDDELAPMPTVPRIRYAEVAAKAARRRTRRRRAFAATGVTLLAAAAAVSAVVVVNRPAPQASVRPVAPLTSAPTSVPTSVPTSEDTSGDSTPEVSSTAILPPAGATGIDGEQMGDGAVPDGTGVQIQYTGQPLVRRSFAGGSVEVPSGWVVKDASLPSDHSDIVIYDPANQTARFELSGSGCVGCASKNGDGVTPNPTPPTATVSSVVLRGGRSVAFTEKPWLGYAVNGVVTVLTGAQDGGTGPIGGYVIYRVALPMDDTALETTILNSVTVGPQQ